jgi:hypothetical protein
LQQLNLIVDLHHGNSTTRLQARNQRRRHFSRKSHTSFARLSSSPVSTNTHVGRHAADALPRLSDSIISSRSLISTVGSKRSLEILPAYRNPNFPNEDFDRLRRLRRDYEPPTAATAILAIQPTLTSTEFTTTSHTLAKLSLDLQVI